MSWRLSASHWCTLPSSPCHPSWRGMTWHESSWHLPPLWFGTPAPNTSANTSVASGNYWLTWVKVSSPYNQNSTLESHQKSANKNPLSPPVDSWKKGVNVYRTWELQSFVGLQAYFNILRTWENLASSAQPSQSLVIPELQLSEVLDGADHLRGVAVLVVVPGHDLHLPVHHPTKWAGARVCWLLT